VETSKISNVSAAQILTRMDVVIKWCSFLGGTRGKVGGLMPPALALSVIDQLP